MENQYSLNDVIAAAGGPVQVAAECGLKSYQAVRKWEKNGLPRTEWTGETSYAATLARLCRRNDRPEFTKTFILKLSQDVRSAA